MPKSGYAIAEVSECSDLYARSWLGRRGLGGGSLFGERLMRLAYLDESGGANAAQEPFIVVAGIMLGPDLAWNLVDAHLRLLMEEWVGREAAPLNGRPFVFHATDIWHGSGLYDRRAWPRDKRMRLLAALAEIPKRFGLDIVYGVVDRRTFGSDDTQAYAMAFIQAARRVDAWMAANAPDEVTMLIAEDTQAARKRIVDALHAAYTDRSAGREPRAFQAKRIVEQVCFFRKDQSAILQVADICAFVLRRRLQKCRHIAPLYANVEPRLWRRRAPGDGVLVTLDRADIEIIDD